MTHAWPIIIIVIQISGLGLGPKYENMNNSWRCAATTTHTSEQVLALHGAMWHNLDNLDRTRAHCTLASLAGLMHPYSLQVISPKQEYNLCQGWKWGCKQFFFFCCYRRTPIGFRMPEKNFYIITTEGGDFWFYTQPRARNNIFLISVPFFWVIYGKHG